MNKTATEQTLYKTIAYFDLFDFAPTLLELEKWLLQKSDHTSHNPRTNKLSSLQEALENDKQIEQAEGFYFLVGRKDLANLRKKKYDHTETKWKHAKPLLKLIAIMPYVEAVWLANSTAWNNARANSDTDLFIITTPGKIWTTRFFTTAIMKLLRQRPDEQTDAKAICLSLYATADHLNLEQYKINDQDIHFSFWATQFYPIYDSGRYHEYQQANPWLNSIFSELNWTKPISHKQIRLCKSSKFVKSLLEKLPLENKLKKWQLKNLPAKLKSMANQDNRVVINDHILKLHTNDERADQHKRWEEKIEKSVSARS